MDTRPMDGAVSTAPALNLAAQFATTNGGGEVNATINTATLPPEIRANIAAQTTPDFIDIKEIVRKAEPYIESICAAWLPDGKRVGHDWVALNPTRTDSTAGSFSVSLIDGSAIDFATGDKCADIVSTVRYLDGLATQLDAARKVADFIGATPMPDIKPTAKKPTPKPMATMPTAHPSLGKPSAQYEYRAANGDLLGMVMRFDTGNGAKEFRPLFKFPDGWYWKAPADPRPLYGLDRLAARPDAPVLVCEGEKATDASVELFPDCACIASMNGAQSPNKSDWSVSQGRDVFIFPDADSAGADYARTVARLALAAGAQSVAIADLASIAALRGSELPKGWDAADALKEGWTDNTAHSIKWTAYTETSQHTEPTIEPTNRDSDRAPQEARSDVYSEPYTDIAPEADNAPSEPLSRLKVCDLSNLWQADLAPPQFVIEPLLPRGHLTLFGGHGGSGKSSVGLAMGAHVACGYSWAGLTVTQGRVLLVSYEDSEELVLWRLKKIALEYQLPFQSLIANMTVIDATQAAALMVEVNEFGVRRMAVTADGQAVLDMVQGGAFDLVILDNASDCFGGNENDRQQVRQFVRQCANAVKAHNGAVMLLAHIDKAAAKYGAAKNSYSGSTAWHNSARSRLALIDDELHQEKLNVGKALAEAIPLEWKGPVPRPSVHSGAQQERAAAAQADDAAILNCFKSAEAVGDTVPAAATGPSTFVHALTSYPECPDALKKNKQRVKESVTRLQIAKIIRRDEYRTADRKTKIRLVLSDDIKHTVAPMCANVELAQIGADWRESPPQPRAPICARGVGIGAHAEQCADSDIGALAHFGRSESETETDTAATPASEENSAAPVAIPPPLLSAPLIEHERWLDAIGADDLDRAEWLKQVHKAAPVADDTEVTVYV